MDPTKGYRFTEYYASAIREQLESGKQLEDIDVDFCLSVIKPLHVTWLIAMYNLLLNKQGYESRNKGTEKILDCQSS